MFNPDEKIVLLTGKEVEAEMVHFFERGFQYGQVYRIANGTIHHCGRDRQELPGYGYANNHSAFAPHEPWRTHKDVDCQQCSWLKDKGIMQ